MKKFIILNVFLMLILSSCGNGQTSTSGTNYYSASFDSYYNVESQNVNNSTTYTLNIIASSGLNSTSNIPLTPNSNKGFTFTTVLNGESAAGQLLIKNGNLGIVMNSQSAGSYFDFASQNASNQQIPDGTYATVCDQKNISPCQIVISSGQISITEYSTSGNQTILCANQSLSSSALSINPYAFSFTCGVEGGSTSGIWFAVPFLGNGSNGVMISEFNPSLNSNDDGTDEIAFKQNSITPKGSYNYVYSGISSGQAGISSASFSNGTVINAVVGTCIGAPCAIISDQFYSFTMTGFDYYNAGSAANYNLVGDNIMNIYQDSYSGIYF